MTQEELFTEIAFGRSSGGIAVGEKLPEECGDLDRFPAIHIKARERFSAVHLISEIKLAFDKEPRFGLEAHARQLDELFSEIHQKHPLLIVVIHNAHHLSNRTISHVQHLREVGIGFIPCRGIILLGDLEALRRKIDADALLRQRTLKIAVDGSLQPWTMAPTAQ
jgi:hypothetical protein